MKNIIEQIAKDNGVTPAEVEKDIREAIEIAMSNPSAKDFWSALCPSGKTPDINTVIEGCVSLYQLRIH